MTTNNINIVREVFEEIFAKGNIDLYGKLIDGDIQVHCPPSWNEIHHHEISGISSARKIDEAYQNAVKMAGVEMHDIIANGDKVVVRWSCKGKRVGDFFGIPPNQK